MINHKRSGGNCGKNRPKVNLLIPNVALGGRGSASIKGRPSTEFFKSPYDLPNVPC